MVFKSWDVLLPSRSEKFIHRIARQSVRLAEHREKKWRARPTDEYPYRLLCSIPWSWLLFGSGPFFTLEIVLIPMAGTVRVQVGRPFLYGYFEREIDAMAKQMVVYVRRVSLRTR